MFRGTPEFNRAKRAALCEWLEFAVALGQSVLVVGPDSKRRISTQRELDEYLDEQGRARVFPWLVSSEEGDQ
jgi:hypothetical protein